MAILGRGELIRRIRAGDLVVSPILVADQIGAASIDLRIGSVVLMVRARGSSHVDPAEFKANSKTRNTHGAEIYRQQKHERYEIPFKDKFSCTLDR
jgi:dCTP deaminase